MKNKKLVTISRDDLRHALFHGLKSGTTRRGLHVSCKEHAPRVKPMSRNKIKLEDIKLEPGTHKRQATIVVCTLCVLGVVAFVLEHYAGLNGDVCYSIMSASLAAPLANLLADL